MKTSNIFYFSFLALVILFNCNLSAQIILSPATFNFGDVELWENQPANFTISNNTNEVVTFLPMYPTEKIQIYNPVQKLLPGESVDIQLFFYTEKEGIFKEWFEIYTSYDEEPLELKIKGKIKHLAVDVLTACPGSITKKEVAAIKAMKAKLKAEYTSSISEIDNEMVFIQKKSPEVQEEKTAPIDKIITEIETKEVEKQTNTVYEQQRIETAVVQQNEVKTEPRNVAITNNYIPVRMSEEDIRIDELAKRQAELEAKNRPVYTDNLMNRRKTLANKKGKTLVKPEKQTLLDRKRKKRTLVKNKESKIIYEPIENQETVVFEEEPKVLVQEKEPEFVAVNEEIVVEKPVKTLASRSSNLLNRTKKKFIINNKPLSVEEFAPNNVLFLIDVSLSMRDDGKLPALKKSLNKLTNVLRDVDKLTIITYATEPNVILETTRTETAIKAEINEMINSLKANGRTNGVSGLELAFDKIQENYIPNANNQIILATDGLFSQNRGKSSNDKETEMMEMVNLKAAENNIVVSVIGFGDNKNGGETMKKLAKNGNGNLIMMNGKKDLNNLIEEIMRQSYYN